MGIYLNPGNKGFQESIRSKIYVDKTNLIACTNELINTKEKYICVSRPRRFGKSMALEMLAAYYSCGCDSRELFEGFKIARSPAYAQHLNQYDVIYLNMQQFLIEAESGRMTEYLEQEVLEELQKTYGGLFTRKGMGLARTLREIYIQTDHQFIFLIDEWDCIMRERQESEALQKHYLDFLRNLLKDQDFVALAYMTGILPVKKYGLHSALNMFREFSMTDQAEFEEYTGFTEKEVRALCSRFDMDFAETGSWYDGYSFTQFHHVYNPKSVVEAMRRRRYSNYWTSTETYEALKIYMDMDFDGLQPDMIRLLGGGRIRVNTRSFQNDMRSLKVKDDVLTLLIHLGYLGYDSDTQEAFIPNREIMEEFENAMSVGGWAQLLDLDYYDLPENVRAELIDGQIYYMGAPSRVHQKILNFMNTEINIYLRSRNGPCEVYPAPFAVKLFHDDSTTVVEPDISVICDVHKLTDQSCTGAPDWIIEIVSPGNPGHDYVRKLNLYMNAGVREYWIVDPMEREIFVYFLEQNKFKVKSYSFQDKIKVNIYDDLWIALAKLQL